MGIGAGSSSGSLLNSGSSTSGTNASGATNNAATSYFFYDALGSVKALSNNLGNLTDTYSYNAYGELTQKTGSTANNYLYTGEQYDSESSNYYLRARYYNPSTTRFTQMDTWAGNAQNPITLNKYLYANASPTMNIDPSGHMGLSDFSATFNIQGRFSAASMQSGRLATQRFFFNAGGDGLGLVGELIKRMAIEAAEDLVADGMFDALDTQGKGTRGHKYFEDRIKALNARIKKFKPLQGIDIQTEVFRFDDGSDARRRASGALGIDVLVLHNQKEMLAFDLKFGRKMSKSRAGELANRFNVGGVIEVSIDLKKVKK